MQISAVGSDYCLTIKCNKHYLHPCRGGSIRIPGVIYTASHPVLVPRLAWKAACQVSSTAAELALQLKVLDRQLLWEGTAILSKCSKARSLGILSSRKSGCQELSLYKLDKIA